MDILQGCYKVTPQDCRYFAAFYFFLRYLNMVLYVTIKSFLYYSYAIYMLVFTIMLIALLKPYKNSIRNGIDICLFALAILLFAALLATIDSTLTMPKLLQQDTLKKNWPVFVAFSCLLPLYGFSLVLYQAAKFLSRVVKPGWLNMLPSARVKEDSPDGHSPAWL